MRIGVIPENPLERIALAAGLAPTPLAESWFTFMLARTIMVATKLGVFEALADGPLVSADVARRCQTDPIATETSLRALAGCGYVHAVGEAFELTRMARRWLLDSSPGSCRDKVLDADLGSEEYDFVLIASLAHDFDAQTNAALLKRVARALRPGGVVALYDAIRGGAGRRVGQIGGLTELYFAMTSAAGVWTAEEMTSWQRGAGLRPRKLMRLRIVRDIAVQAAVK